MFFKKRRRQAPPGFVHLSGARGKPVKEFVSPQRQFKIIISAGPMLGFQVNTYHLVLDDQFHPEGYWEQVDGPSYTDSLETAERLAQEQLAQARREEGAAED